MLSYWLATRNGHAQLQEDISSVSSSCLLPSGDQSVRDQREIAVPGEKQNTSGKFSYGKNDSILESGITNFPRNWEGMRTCCRYQHFPADAQITVAWTSPHGAKMKTLPASFSGTQATQDMPSNPCNRSLFCLKNSWVGMRKPGLALTLKHKQIYLCNKCLNCYKSHNGFYTNISGGKRKHVLH